MVAVSTAAIIPTGAATAHPPHGHARPVHPRYDLIGPIGNRLPAGYRRTFNRPRDWTGRAAYWIAPSSQEAIAWHRAEHRGDYDCQRGAVVPIYEHLKPWEAIRIGSRPAPNQTPPDDQQQLLESAPDLEPPALDELVDPMMETVPLEDIVPPVQDRDSDPMDLPQTESDTLPAPGDDPE